MCPDAMISGPIITMQKRTFGNTTDIAFDIPELVPYINWIYFYHAWGIKEEQGYDLKKEVISLLDRWSGEGRETVFRVCLFPANSHDEDILLYEKDREHAVFQSDNAPHPAPLHIIPLLRQQQAPFLCLADFLPPVGHKSETIGIFASSVPFSVEDILEQTVADRLAEATAEIGHEQVRKHIWGYAQDERLTPKEMFAERYIGKRPATGYPSLPDQSLNFLLSNILDMPSMGIKLSENGAMIPHASTSGLMISHPQCRHFSIGKIGEDQLTDYAIRRNIDEEMLRKFLNVI